MLNILNLKPLYKILVYLVLAIIPFFVFQWEAIGWFWIWSAVWFIWQLAALIYRYKTEGIVNTNLLMLFSLPFLVFLALLIISIIMAAVGVYPVYFNPD